MPLRCRRGRSGGGIAAIGRWYDGGGPPTTAQPLSGGRPLDPERPAPDAARPDARPAGTRPPSRTRTRRARASSDDAAPASTAEPAAGPARQLGATRDALIGLVQAHIDLAKAEADEIKGEIGRPSPSPAGSRSGRSSCVALLVPIGGMLFLGRVAVRLDRLGRAPGHRGAHRCSASPPSWARSGPGVSHARSRSRSSPAWSSASCSAPTRRTCCTSRSLSSSVPASTRA